MKKNKAYQKLIGAQASKGTMLCVGLDSDLNKIPPHLGDSLESLLEFNRNVIDATKDLACSYKLNFAFYEQYGAEGFEILKKTFEYIPSDIFTIADAKRGDIGNTSKAYARSCFEYFGADSITVNPYMGFDSVEPFLGFEDKIVFLLALTSNQGSRDFQRLEPGGRPLYQHVLQKSAGWGDNIGFVIGATHPAELAAAREISTDSIFLIPGIGAQGGSISETLAANGGKPAVINVSRDIIYASSSPDFESRIRDKAKHYKELLKYNVQ